MWELDQAVELCRQIEAICPEFGCHVGLTGGTLYKDGKRKDLDIIFYRIRQIKEIDVDKLFNALELIGIVKTGGFGWVHKAVYKGAKNIDVFFPEEPSGEYPVNDELQIGE